MQTSSNDFYQRVADLSHVNYMGLKIGAWLDFLSWGESAGIKVEEGVYIQICPFGIGGVLNLDVEEIINGR